jgi:hypothetical protein
MDKSIPDFLRRNRTPLDSGNRMKRRISSKNLPQANVQRKALNDSPEVVDFDSPPDVEPFSSNRSMYRGMTPQEIAEKCVPSSREEQFQSMAEMISVSSSHKKIEETLKGKFDEWASNEINDVDFSKSTRSKLISLVSSAISESPAFYQAIQNYGIPSLVVRTKDAESKLMSRGFVKEHLEESGEVDKSMSFAHSIFDPFANEISFSPSVLDAKIEVPSFENPVQVDMSFSGYLRHEWGHYLHLAVLNDMERSVGIASSNRKSKSKLMSIAEKYCSQTPLMKLIDKTFGETPDTPRAVSQLAHESMMEMFAEGVSAHLHPDLDVGRKSINSVLRKDIVDVLGTEEAEA